MARKIETEDTALVVVDMLYDFIDGSLACENAEDAVAHTLEFINSASEEAEVSVRASKADETDDNGIEGGYPVLFVCDHHPLGHCSFKENGGIWPVHCVGGTRGGEIHNSLKPFVIDELTFYKGCDKNAEQYSGFEGLNQSGQSLAEVLELLDIKSVYVCGIATEYCVRNTCEDLQKAGFNVTVLQNALAYVDKAGHENALADMKRNGIKVI